jgi:methylenetetrahydrofolate reductase (NADPH)
MAAAARGLGFAGAHIGGFGLTHRDFMTIVERAETIGNEWRNRMDELLYSYPDQFYLFPKGADGLSDGQGNYAMARVRPRKALRQRLSGLAHRWLIAPDSPGARFFARRLKPEGGNSWRRAFWSGALALSSPYRKAALGCLSCGDCIQDYLGYAGCSMRWCYKELRNGPCGGSRPDGTCEARPELECLWNRVYRHALAAGADPRRFAECLVPPRNWSLNGGNALVHRLAGLDNFARRRPVKSGREKTCS